ncbi:M3 family metallopeptidase [Synechococcus sp. CS-1324]|uniref:M3 family metallopeptidase n=1 Tax=Synechococcus sp. CS-1324 TaxID=2847980 RepID=UPI000DB0234F|nr:M3 family metallopeptidase [Synechococcus sp. CS-1324]MCT0229396.1 M3 family metallopeptidase [Synechococcus sp. CS-1324]PZV06118.1 MAG: peptidase M3 [Cyanobium sp.]
MPLSTLVSPLLVGEGLPRYEAIDPEQVSSQIPLLLGELESELAGFERQLEPRLEGSEPLGWEELMGPLERLSERLRWSWGVVSHLVGVCNTPELREAHLAQQSAVVAFTNRASQSPLLYRALERLQAQHDQAAATDPLRLDATQQRILTAERRDRRLRGVGLAGPEQEAFNQASEELSALSSRFGNNVLDATNDWTLELSSPHEVEGLPASLLALLAQAAGHGNAESGPWLLGLDHPRYGPFLQYSQRRDLRERAYRAFVGRAASEELDNRPLIERILVLRGEQARRLGFANWAELSLSRKMAGSVEAVEQLLDDLRAAAWPMAQRELAELAACAARHGAPEAAELRPWDLPFWSERLRRERFDLDSEALRPWFPLPAVLDGLFSLCGRLFGIRIEAADGAAPLWHPDVRFFRVIDQASGAAIAAFYLDPYSRPGSKRGGAWMDDCLGRSRDAEGQPVLPVAYLICNQSPPVADTPSLMTFQEVETLFHEFGHGLQHMLTTVERPQAAGINRIEWDAVELPSQFMENWCYDRATLLGMARHWQNGSALPEADFARLLAARTFMAGAATLRQVHLALVDLRLHSQWQPECGLTPQQLRQEIAATTSLLPLIEADQTLCSFGHIFAGGYAAGYYSYKWAEVLSADAFSAFEEVGLENEAQIRATGRRFRDTVLSLGGSRSPEQVFEAFRGRAPSPEALIRHSGLLAA